MPAKLPASLRQPDVRLAISPVAEVGEVGQPIKVRVVAEAVRDSSIAAARADLVAKVWLRKPQIIAGAWGAAPGSTQPQQTITGTGSYLSLTGSLAAGARAECEAVLPNWAAAPSGGLPPGRRIEYLVRAELDLAGGGKVRSEAPVRLVSAPSLYQAVEGTQGRRRSRRCDLELIAPALRVRPGETLGGTLRVVPHQPMRARSVSLFVVRQQSVPKSWRLIWGRDLAKDVELDGPREFAFEAKVPREAPTMISPQLTVRWHLRAIVRYGLVAADRCDWEINVYSEGS